MRTCRVLGLVNTPRTCQHPCWRTKVGVGDAAVQDVEEWENSQGSYANRIEFVGVVAGVAAVAVAVALCPC